jgi:hypothetical protein
VVVVGAVVVVEDDVVVVGAVVVVEVDVDVVVVGATVVVVVDVDVLVDVEVVDVEELELVVVVIVRSSGKMMCRYASLVFWVVRLNATRTWQIRQSGSPLFGDGSFGDKQLNLSPPPGFGPLNGNNRWLSSVDKNDALPFASVLSGALPVVPSQ